MTCTRLLDGVKAERRNRATTLFFESRRWRAVAVSNFVASARWRGKAEPTAEPSGAERNLTKHTRRDGRGTKNKNKKTQSTRSTTTALRVPGALGAAAQTYARCMDKAPLATKAATSAAIFGASDACAQKLERVKEPDATRLLTTTAIGGLYFAPAVLRSAWENASTASRWRR